jgi:hypothetical protein
MGQKDTERELDIKGNEFQNNYEHISVTKCGGGGGGGRGGKEKKFEAKKREETRNQGSLLLFFFFEKSNWHCNQNI